MRENRYEREAGYALRYRDTRFLTGTGRRTDRRERAVLRRLLARASWQPGPWLDAPCGAGRMSAELPGPVVQLDRDPAMVRAAPGARPRVCASAQQLPFATDAFAGALCHRLLQHIPTAVERIDILRELARVTRGPIVVSFFDAASLQHLRRGLRNRLGRRRSGRSAVSRAMFARELEAAGLRLLALGSLCRYVSEQTLALCLRQSA
ncbi:MAG: class I SAM-dependent methyltransferase [Planctomycetes bacterium]|nr:class I SAM-dependent methyltransferase [Planctomycetota bacterium]